MEKLGVPDLSGDFTDMSELESGHAETSELEHNHWCWKCGDEWGHAQCPGDRWATCPRCEG